MSIVRMALALGFAVAGFEKLMGGQPYQRVFRHLGWNRDQMRAVGIAEVSGAALLLCPCTRRLGGGLLAGTSAMVLRDELRHRDPHLAVPRAALMTAALAVLLLPSRR